MTDRMRVGDVVTARWLLMAFGLASALLGLALVLWPRRTLTVVLILVGLYMLLFGLVRFLVAVLGDRSEYRWLQAFLGVVGIAFGVVVIRQPEGALGLVVLLVGLFWLVSGLVDTFRTTTDRGLSDRGYRAGLAVVSIAAGIVVLLWPAVTVTVLGIIAGVQLLVSGVFEIIAAARLREA